MQYFQDSATGKVWAFADNVVAKEVAGVYNFSVPAPGTLPANIPTTLQPTAGPAVQSPAQLWEVFQGQAKQALADDITPDRIMEAVALGLNSFTGADVVAWVNYRRELRAIVSAPTGTPGTLPVKPAYPAGT